MSRGTTSGRLRLLAAAACCVVGIAVPAGAAHAAAGGPVVLMGIDAEDGGVNGHGPIANYAQVVNSMLPNVTNGGSGILVVGGGSGSTYVRQFFSAIGAHTGQPVTFVTGSAINTVDLTGRKLIAVASDNGNTPSGGLTSAENTALIGRKADIADHVNAGGALLGFSQSRFGTAAYAYLGDLGTFTANTGLGYSNITPTADGLAIGITNALDVCCWHDEYVTFPSFLKVLATNAGTGRAAAIGGVNVVISDLFLAPPSQQHNLGQTATVTATATQNSSPLGGKLVTFTVLSGPNAGLTGTATTDSAGEASLSYTSTAAGTDTVEASFVDNTGRTQKSNNVLVEWIASNQPPVVSAGGPYSGDEGAPVALDATVSDPDGDAVSVHWTYAPVNADSGATCTFGDDHAVDTSFECTDDGEYEVKITGNDGHNQVQESVIVTYLDNVAPELSALALSGAQAVACQSGNTLGLGFSISDQGANDTHSGTIDWGDGSAAEAFSGSPFSGSHLDSAGTYVLNVNATDDDGASDSAATAAGAISFLYDTGTGFLPPIANGGEPRSVFRLGSTIPVKILPVDCAGLAVTTLAPKVGLRKVDSTPATEVNEVVSSSAADTGDTMRWSDDKYIYNLSTKNSQFCTEGSSMCTDGDLTPGTYELRVTHPTLAPVVTRFDLRSR